MNVVHTSGSSVLLEHFSGRRGRTGVSTGGEGHVFLYKRKTYVSRGGVGRVFLEELKDLCFYRRGRTCASRGEVRPVFLEEGKDL